MSVAQGALSHLKILDMSRVLAGPWATQTFGDMGAEIWKIERPVSGDETRSWGPPFVQEPDGDVPGISAYFANANRKKNLSLLILPQKRVHALFTGLLEKPIF